MVQAHLLCFLKGREGPGSTAAILAMCLSSPQTLQRLWVDTSILCVHVIYKDPSAQRLWLCAAGHKVDFSLEYNASFVTLPCREKNQSCPPTLLFCIYSKKKFLQTLSWRQILDFMSVLSFCILGSPSIIHTSQSRSVDVLLLTKCSCASSSEYKQSVLRSQWTYISNLLSLAIK